MNPLLSVAVITYNHGKFIRRALESVVSQEVQFPIEVCIGDDQSNDGTQEICQEFKERYPRVVRLYSRDRADSNRLAYSAPFLFNVFETLKSCRGKYIALLEGDDYWTDPQKLAEQVKFLERQHDYNVVFHNILEDINGVVKERFPEHCELANENRDFGPEHLWFPLRIQTSSAVVRNGTFEELYSEAFRAAAGYDVPLFFLASRTGRIRYFHRCMGVYRIHPHGVWSGSDSKSHYAMSLSIFAPIVAMGITKDKAEHNLRSLIDYNAFQLARRVSGADEFFSCLPESVRSSLWSSMLSGWSSQAAVMAILDSQQLIHQYKNSRKYRIGHCLMVPIERLFGLWRAKRLSGKCD